MVRCSARGDELALCFGEMVGRRATTILGCVVLGEVVGIRMTNSLSIGEVLGTPKILRLG